MNQYDYKKAGFIGLGSLGLVLAQNLIARGVAVHGYRRSDMAQFREAGGFAAEGAADVALKARVVFTCLPTLASLQETVEEFLTLNSPAPIVIELGVFPVTEKLKLRDNLRERGGDLLDCPVSGTPGMAKDRKGLILTSGDESCFQTVQPLLKNCLDQVIYCGEFGNSSKLKYIANMLVGAHIFAAQEAIRFSEALGLDSGLVVEILKDSGAGSNQLKMRGPMMASREFPEPLGSSSLVVKDLQVIQDAAREIGFETDLIDTVLPRFEKAVSAGLGERDVAESITVASKKFP
ncbi:NAD(P)-dependent oxidoreductase [Ruegeria arenilitoris]|uniref:NAD(P)-dependent oxidoreductase n=1 Tax=Ruegeria arenilitoris TaxID=1173585 RepID=UPI0014809E20|nr:NAD(P)-dependent oxidoreductase [Ruegeria arenilitoris]